MRQGNFTETKTNVSAWRHTHAFNMYSDLVWQDVQCWH